MTVSRRQSDFDIVCLSTNHWTGLPTSKQHLMSVFARTRRVLYVDPPVDVFSALGRRRNWAKFRGLRRVMDRLWVLSTIAPSVHSDPDWALSYYETLAKRVHRASAELGFGRTVVWSFAPEQAGCASRLGADLRVYHAADEPATKSRNPARTTEIERAFISDCDVTFVVSRALLESRRSLGNVRRLPNAADRRHYARVLAGDPDASLETLLASLRAPRHVPDEIRTSVGPVIMFGGAAYGWFDGELLLALAELRPSWTFLLVGPLSRAMASLRFPPNVVAVGRKSYEDFVWYVASADAGVIPLVRGESARNCDPIVMYEFLLCGKPVVATDFPAAREHGLMVRVAPDAAGFAAVLDEELAADGGEEVRRRRAAFGFSNTWEDRADTAMSVVNDLFAATPRDGRGVSDKRGAGDDRGARDGCGS